uniref:Sorting nexin 22 n=1 Tax=Calidris pygmaea TaxID=425635 RepID=A0A8C3JAS6_9CHAR
PTSPIPSFPNEELHLPQGLEILPQVFRVEVLCNGRRHTVAKRYSEFQALHKRIKKTCKVPDFPPRRVPNWMPKVLEQRRQGLELYIRGVLYHNKELPQDVLDFLKVRRCQQDPKATSTGKGWDPGCWSPKAPRNVGFFPLRGPEREMKVLWVPLFLADLLPDTVLSGVLQGLYIPLSCVPPWPAPPTPNPPGS